MVLRRRATAVQGNPAGYRRYLEARNYDYVIAGEDRLNLGKALEIIGERFGARKVRVER